MKTLTLILIFFCAICVVQALEVNITTAQLPYSTNLSISIHPPLNETISLGCSSWISGCNAFISSSSPTVLSLTLNITNGTSPGNFEQTVLASGTNYTEQQNISISITQQTIISEGNFTINVTYAEFFANYYLVQLYGPNSTQVNFTAGEMGKNPAVSGSRKIGENNIDGVYQFYYSPTNNGIFLVKADFVYNNQAFHKEFTFNVNMYKNLEYNLHASTTAPFIGQTVQFFSNLTAYENPVTYAWDFTNDGTIDSTAANVSFVYTTAGQKTLNLTVTDRLTTKTTLLTMNVAEQPFLFTVIVKNGQAPVESAIVHAGSLAQVTNGSGETIFNISPGVYEIKVTKVGFLNYSTSVNISAATSLSLVLQPLNITPLAVNITTEQILLESPADLVSLSATETIELRYQVQNAFVAACEVLLISALGEERSLGTDNEVPPNSVQNAQIVSPDPGSYTWLVQCKDRQGNTAKSSSRALTIQSRYAQLIEQEKEKYQPEVEKLTAALEEIRVTNDPLLKELQTLLGIRDNLYKKREELTNAIAQFDSIDPLIEEEYFDKEISLISAKIAAILDEAPTEIILLDTAEFVYLPSSKDVETTAPLFLEQHAEKKISLKKYLKEAILFQKDVSLHTTTALLEIRYGSSRKEHLTYVERELSAKEEKNTTYLEVIPQGMVDGFDKLELFIEDYQTLQANSAPAFALPVSEVPLKIRYFIKKQLFSGDVERFSASLLPLPQQQSNSLMIILIGTCLFGAFALTITQHKKLRAQSVRKIYSSSMNLLSNLIGKHHLTKKQILELEKTIEEVYVLAAGGQEQKSAQVYEKVNALYQTLEPQQKGIIDEKLEQLKHRLIVLHIRNGIVEAMNHVKNNIFHEAKRVYEDILPLYAHLPQPQQNELQIEILTLKQQVTALYKAQRGII